MSQLRDVAAHDSDDSAPRGAEPASEPELLTFGPARDFWSLRRRRRLGLAMIVLALVLVGGSLIRSWLQTSDPTLSHDDLETVYRTPSTTGTVVGWDRASTFGQPAEVEIGLPVTQPADCGVLMVPGRPPAFLDRVGAVLTPGLETGIWSGSATTYRYVDPAQARRKFAQLQAATGQCPSFRSADTVFVVDAVSAPKPSRARSVITFSITSSADPGAYRFALVRYGNTISWVSTSESRRDPLPIADTLVAGFRQLR